MFLYPIKDSWLQEIMSSIYILYWVLCDVITAANDGFSSHLSRPWSRDTLRPAQLSSTFIIKSGHFEFIGNSNLTDKL